MVNKTTMPLVIMGLTEQRKKSNREKNHHKSYTWYNCRVERKKDAEIETG